MGGGGGEVGRTAEPAYLFQSGKQGNRYPPPPRAFLELYIYTSPLEVGGGGGNLGVLLLSGYMYV